MFVMDYYGHKLSNGVLFAHHLILDVPGGSSHLGYRRRVPPGHNPPTRVKYRQKERCEGDLCPILPIYIRMIIIIIIDHHVCIDIAYGIYYI